MIIGILLKLLVTYLACGLVFAIVFVIKGVQIVDEGAHGAGIGFRIIIIPGTMVFWPALLRKWIRTIKSNNITSKDKQYD